MTEAEWLAATDPATLLAFLKGKVSDRKLRLFACACCRRAERFLTAPEALRGLQAAERYAEGQMSPRTAAKWARRVRKVRTALLLDHHQFTPEWLACHAVEFALSVGRDTSFLMSHNEVAHAVAVATGELSSRSPFRTAWRSEAGHLSSLVRDIVGKPFRPASVDSAWRTFTVVALAQGIYEVRAFDRLPILADALMDAGCDSDDLLNHLRGDGPHVRGCWALALVLGKE